MLLLISPAKTLDFSPSPTDLAYTLPKYLTQSQQLIHHLRQFTPEQLAKLMKLSNKLADLNVNRYHQWHTPFTFENAKPALLAFKGDVYTGLSADTFTSKQFHYAQQHLRILSGLYGILRPLDLMQAYRLEMGTALSGAWGKNLYAFWGNMLTQDINQELTQHKEKVIINLTSKEYFKVIKVPLLQHRLIHITFKEFRGDSYRIIALYAKKARGLMSQYIIKNHLQHLDEIKSFNLDGYHYNAVLSNENEWVFTREQD